MSCDRIEFGEVFGVSIGGPGSRDAEERGEGLSQLDLLPSDLGVLPPQLLCAEPKKSLRLGDEDTTLRAPSQGDQPVIGEELSRA